uniref:Uncharacterized protein n=1 Tax=Caenorhabditis japonica TaxID=281687 RepID=A0A8R1I2A4_CAEJA
MPEKPKVSKLLNGTAPLCNVTHSELSLVFPPGSSLASLQSEIKGQIVSALRDAVCVTAVEALTFVMAQKPIQPENPTYEKPLAADPNGFSVVELGASLCKVDTVNGIENEEDREEEDQVRMLAPKISDESNNQTLIDGQGEPRQAYWGVDLSVNHPPTFTDEDMIIGFDGGILFNGWKSESAHQPHVLNKTRLDKKMVGILLSDYIPNTLFHHIYMYDLGNFRQRQRFDGLQCQPGPHVRAILLHLYDVWQQSRYEKGKLELLNHISEVAPPPKSTQNRKRSRSKSTSPSRNQSLKNNSS